MPQALSDTDFHSALRRLRILEQAEPPTRSRGPEKLAGILALLESLGNPHQGLRVVHVAGTNGKGMTAFMIEALLRHSGASTGLYTSPHLVHVRERIRLDGVPLAPGPFSGAAHLVLDHAQALEGGIVLSYFDVLTAIAFQTFRDARVDWTVLEVGLGGASDATNVVEKELAVITRIGLDHQHILGDDLQSIATQKLGILQPGVPLVLAPQQPELDQWMTSQAKAMGCKVYPVPTPEEITGFGTDQPESTVLEINTMEPAETGNEIVQDTLVPRDWVTRPRLQCAATAKVAMEVLFDRPARRLSFSGPKCRSRSFLLGDAAEAIALRTVVPGRLDLRENVVSPLGHTINTLLLDGAHNADALEVLVEQMELWGLRGVTLILSLQSDKLTIPVGRVLARLLKMAELLVLPRSAQPRTATPEKLISYLEELLPEGSPPCEVVHGIVEALDVAAQTPQRPCVATGSLWMVGGLLGVLESGDLANAETSPESLGLVEKINP